MNRGFVTIQKNDKPNDIVIANIFKLDTISMDFVRSIEPYFARLSEANAFKKSFTAGGTLDDSGIQKLFFFNIPYKGFRKWESTDGLFKTTAKFIFYDAKVKEATLERENGKQTTIEWSALRKEDQEYIRELDQEKLKE